MLSELKNAFRLRDKEADFEIEECFVNGLIYTKGKNDVADLRRVREIKYFIIFKVCNCFLESFISCSLLLPIYFLKIQAQMFVSLYLKCWVIF